MAKKEEGPAVEKRKKISKSQQEIILFILITSLIFGVCIVLSIYCVKMINYQSKIIEAEDRSIANYTKTITNVGVCRDENKDGQYSSEELDRCNPNNLTAETMPGTLRYNVLVGLADNEDLESVAREAQTDCFDQQTGVKIDYKTLYENEENSNLRGYYLDMMKACSALRAVPDALPAQENVEALLASLNQIFNLSNWTPKSLAPNDTATASSIDGVGAIPVSLSVEADDATTLKVLSNIERSIRTFEMSRATISWSGTDTLTLRAQAVAYYTDEEDLAETTTTVYADDSKKSRSGSATSSASTATSVSSTPIKGAD